MKVKFLNDPFEHIIFEDVYDEKEYSEVIDELEWIVSSNSLDSVDELEKSGVASDPITKKVLSNKKCLFLDNCYNGNKRSLSKILTHNKKLVSLNEYGKKTIDDIHNSILFKLYLKIINEDTTLINFYQGGGDYKPHTDSSLFTILWFHWKNRESFKGGDLFFPEHPYSFPCNNNTAIMFPGPMVHSVEKLLQIGPNISETDGRYSISQFLWYNFKG